MSIISKDTTDTLGSSLAESATTQLSSSPRPSSPGQVHSDAVSLEVPLRVHGSKVTELVQGVPPRTEPFEEQTSSMIVFPNGGVLRMATAVNAGQMLVLTNIKSRQDAICRVVKVRNYSGSSSYVEVEFTHRQPGFWGVYFEADNIPSAPPAGSVAPAEAALKSSKQPAASATPSSATPKQGSPFIGIGSQEDVQPSASSTVASPGLKAAPSHLDSRIAKKPSAAAPTSPTGAAASVPAAPPRASRTQQEEEDASIASDIASETLGEDSDVPADSSSALSGRARAEAFGSGLSAATDDKQQGDGTPKNWLLIAACGVGLLVLTGGVVLFSHHKSSEPAAAQAVAPVSAPAAQAQAAAVQPDQSSAPPPVAKPAPAPAAAVREAPPAPPRPSRESVVITESPSEAEPSAPAAAPRKTTSNVPSVFGTLNAHPTASREVSAAVAAPTVNAAPPAGSDALLGITSPSGPGALPAPGSKGVNASAAATAAAAVPVGGAIRQPKLLSTAVPAYPPLATQAHTQGDVVIQIVVDKSGNVTQPKVISGPMILRMAAIQAVQRWKYEPSTLDGQPTPVQILVTIRFRL